MIKNGGSLISEDIINENEGYMHDVYVVDKDCSWTYI
jgi:hypothetical protein